MSFGFGLARFSWPMHRQVVVFASMFGLLYGLFVFVDSPISLVVIACISALSYAPCYITMNLACQRAVPIEHLTEAIRMAGLTPQSIAFRGGTDGSALSHRGLPCPNLSAGYENAHGRFEYVPIPSMEKNVEILLHLARLFAE